MDAKTLRQKFIDFFKQKGHVEVPSASLVPNNDPTVLFNTAGMQPLVPYLLGQKHPLGKRLVNVQKCLRTVDFENIGDNTHHTFFQMLGNWSLGDYFKKESIAWSFEFLTSPKWLNIPKEKLAFTVYCGDKQVPKDEESAKLWISQGVDKDRIAYLGKDDNWWSVGDTGPCGPDTEIFYWTGKEKAPKKFEPKDSKWVEIWNNVFMMYNRKLRTILADATHVLFDENGPNQKLIEFLLNSGSRIIVVSNASKEEVTQKLSNYNFEIFTLLNNPAKSNSEYFSKLLKQYNLLPNEVIYFDHKKEYVDSAQKIGIKSMVYKDNSQVMKFVEENKISVEELKNKNVDTGMGYERTLAILSGKESAYETDLFLPVIEKICEISGKKYLEHKKEMRIIADHLRASTFIICDGVVPSNKDRGYILRRLIRRAIVFANKIGITSNFVVELAKEFVSIYKNWYPELEKNKKAIFEELTKEEQKFRNTLNQGLKEFEKLSKKGSLTSQEVFLLYQSYGFPIEMTLELAAEKKIKLNEDAVKEEFKKHQELSRSGAAQKFKGGLSDSTDATTKLHTATHLLNEALRKIVSKDIKQKGSNITSERLRFDFNFDRKLTADEIKKIEDEVNKVIKQGLDIKKEEMPLEKALKSGAQAEFGMKYPEKVSVYSIGNYSKEICMGPHVKNTKELGKFKIVKEEASASGIRRIKAVLE